MSFFYGNHETNETVTLYPRYSIMSLPSINLLDLALWSSVAVVKADLLKDARQPILLATVNNQLLSHWLTPQDLV